MTVDVSPEAANATIVPTEHNIQTDLQHDHMCWTLKESLLKITVFKDSPCISKIPTFKGFHFIDFLFSVPRSALPFSIHRGLILVAHKLTPAC